MLDRTPQPWGATSLRGEGKLHLGYVYANETDRQTAATMLQGAFTFSGLLDGWTDRSIDWASVRSSPFVYGVLPDTMVSTDRLTEHYAWVDAQAARYVTAGQTYAGLSRLRPVESLADHSSQGLSDRVSAAFVTDEVAIYPRHLRAHILEALERNSVRFIGSSTVTAVERRPEGMEVTCVPTPGTPADGQPAFTVRRADLVVNCLWEGRLRVDESFGINTTRPCFYRLKFGLNGTITGGGTQSALQSTTFVLGPFGDIVRFPSDRVYLSWYPDCMTDSQIGSEVPASWYSPIAGETGAEEQARLVSASVRALSGLAPAVARVQIDDVAAGVVVAWGSTDIDDHRSELHHRYEIGVHDHDGYLSIDTGKFTMAPYFADLAVRAAG
jgi:hypothetical protein